MAHHYSLRSSAKTISANRPSSEIFNGARCKAYSWSQGHGDLEIRVKLAKAVKHEQVSVSLSKNEICVSLVYGYKKETIVEGRFEHQIDVESAYWVIEKEGPHLAIFIDKAEEMWWKRLLENEEVSEQGPKCFSVPMDQLDEGSRMVIDKLVTKQRRKLLNENNADRLSPA